MRPFTSHPDARLTPVEEVPSLDASELAWSGWPFDNLAKESESLAYSDPHLEKLEIEEFRRREEWKGRVHLLAILKATRPAWKLELSSFSWT